MTIPTDTPPEECRAAFQARFRSNYDYKILHHALGGCYSDPYTRHAYGGWQACWNRTSPPASNEDAIPNHALDVLKELVSLKMLSDEYGDCLKTAYTDLAFDYRHRKQDAWQEAKSIVETQAAIASMRHHPAPAVDVEGLIGSLKEEMNATIHLAATPEKGDGGLTYIDGLVKAISIIRQYFGIKP